MAKAITWVDAGSLGSSHVTAIVYGAPGVGKTSLALTAKRPLVLDFDGRLYRASQDLRGKKAAIQVNKWTDVPDLAGSDLSDIDTIVVDTVGAAIDICSEDIIRRNPKMGSSGQLTRPGYGALKMTFSKWLESLARLGKDVVIVAHSEEKAHGEETVERIAATGSSKDAAYRAADIVGRMSADGDVRTISFDMTPGSYQKNVGVRSRTFALADASAMADLLDEARACMLPAPSVIDLLPEEPTAADMTAAALAMIEQGATADERRRLGQKANNAGFVWDKKSKKFVLLDDPSDPDDPGEQEQEDEDQPAE